MTYFHGARWLIPSVGLMLAVLMAGSCSQSSDVQTAASAEALAALPPDQLLWNYIAVSDSAKVAELLQSNPELVNIYDPTYYNTPLHSAALRGDWDIVKVLIENGADLYAENENGEIPAESALQEAHLDLSKYLQEAAQAQQSAE